VVEVVVLVVVVVQVVVVVLLVVGLCSSFCFQFPSLVSDDKCFQATFEAVATKVHFRPVQPFQHLTYILLYY